VKLGGGLCPLNRAAIILNRDLGANDGQASRHVVGIIDRCQYLRAAARQYNRIWSRPGRQKSWGEASLFADTIALVSVQASPTFLTAASA
jgi:hypothetical protein